MSTTVTAVETGAIEHVPAIIEFDNKKSIITNIGYTRGATTKYEIIFAIPATDAEAQTRYGCDLAYLIAAGIRQLTTRVDYKTVGFNDDGTLKPGGHQAMQDLADGYKIGRKADPLKAEEKQALNTMKTVSKELGMSPAELMAKMKELKEAGLLA